MRKTFVLDTNVLLHNPESFQVFEDNNVILPMAVIEELDKFKTQSSELGRNARHVIRQLDALRVRGNLGKGVVMENGGTISILVGKDLVAPTGLDASYADNRIISVAYHVHSKNKDNPEEKVIFVSKDINCRLKADALGIEVEDYENQKVDFEDLYSGMRDLPVPGDLLNQFYKEGSIEIGGELNPNEFVHMVDSGNEKHSGLGRAIDEKHIGKLSEHIDHVYSIKPRNKEQRMALDILLDPKVKLVTLVGQAGTGKTLLALAAALQCMEKHQMYEKILVTRPIIPMGKDIGYLPGGKDDKLQHWMQPIFDNLVYLMSNGPDDKDSLSAHRKVDELMKRGDVELEALTYIRGRSIPHQLVIVDEAQNLTPHEVKTIISRAGEGTKMVLTGDPHQIDNPYLDSASNGLSYCVERMKGSDQHGHITLHRSERSDLAALAAELL